MGENLKPDGLENFLNSCDEFIQGKFILADIKISKILRAISTSKEIYNLMAESLINYDFKKEYTALKAQADEQGKDFSLPSDAQSIISFVFAMLVEIDSKRIDFSDLLSTTFPYATSQREEYAMFSQKFILPFKNSVARVFGIMPNGDVSTEEAAPSVMDEKPHEEKEEAKPDLVQDDTALLFDGIARKCSLIEEKLQNSKTSDRRANILLLTRAMKEACGLRKMNIVVALVMSLNEFSYRERFIRNEVHEINEICFQFYS